MKTKTLLILFFSAILFTSCGISASVVGNGTTTLTTVELSKKNFKILDKVSGKSSNTYIFGIGGLSNTSVLENAKSKMFDNANLKGGAKTIANITYDAHYSFVFPIFMKKTITASGYVIEFTE